MVKFCIALLFTIMKATMSQAFQVNVPPPVYAPCNKQLMDISKGLWTLRGQKNDIFPTIDKQNYLAVLSTFDQIEGIKCYRINASMETATFDIYFYQTNGCQPALLRYSNVTEEDGKLIMDGGKVLVFPFTIDENGLSYYVCSPNSTSKSAPLVVVLSNLKYVNNPWVKSASDLMTTFFTAILGKDLASIFTYGNACLFG